jgi:hypothetical protein
MLPIHVPKPVIMEKIAPEAKLSWAVANPLSVAGFIKPM